HVDAGLAVPVLEPEDEVLLGLPVGRGSGRFRRSRHRGFGRGGGPPTSRLALLLGQLVELLLGVEGPGGLAGSAARDVLSVGRGGQRKALAPAEPAVVLQDQRARVG